MGLSRSVFAANRNSATLAIALLAATSTFASAGDELADIHWSFRPPTLPDVPQFTAGAKSAWVRTPIDAFILARLDAGGLQPAPEADRDTLVRRLYLDLTGLPPSPAELDAYRHDDSPRAYDRLVNRLLASPRYGERWGRHWLDVVRFAETEGFEYDRYRPGAWRYRDYVVRSFNEDKPFDRFVYEQLAGDEIVPHDDEAQIAAGFHRLGPIRRNAGNAEVAFSRNEVLTEMTDIVGSAFLGLTLGCARCHDHMFDPIPQVDYYRLQAFLAAVQEDDIPLVGSAERSRWQDETDEVNREIEEVKKALKRAEGLEEQRLIRKMRSAEHRLPPPLPTVFSVKNVLEQQTPIHVLQRGDASHPGERVDMGVLSALSPQPGALSEAENGRPKTALARWIIDPGHPLTARVMANRIWQYHFGQGLVRTANDFGLNGDSPSHPELLDYLALRFVSGGWKIKSLHRLIVTSSTYRQSSRSPRAAEASAVDPENRWLWRFNRRRLSAEEIRDAMLSISAALNEQMGGPSVMLPVDQELIDLLYKPSQWNVTDDRRQHDRRSIYLAAKRNLRLPFMDVFDQPDLQRSCACRESSTHAPQALEMLNGRIANRLAASLARRLAREAAADVRRQVELAYRLCTAREPNEAERQLAIDFLATEPLEEFALAMFNLNAFVYVD